MIEITQTEGWFETFHFPTAAISKEKHRRNLQYLLVKEDAVIATDGRRLHIAHSRHPVEPGFYEVVKRTKSKVIIVKSNSDISYPKYENVIPHHQNIIIDYNRDYYIAESVMCVLGKVNIMLEYAFLQPLAEIDTNWTIYYGNPDQPVRFITPYNSYTKRWLEAVIMPIDNNLAQAQFITKAQHKRSIA